MLGNANSRISTGLLLWGIFLLHPAGLAAQSPYPLFDEWPLRRLGGGLLVCSEYQTAFYDNFAGTQLDSTKWDTYENGNPLGGRFHCGAEAAIFTDDNVRVNNQLELTVKRPDSGVYVLQSPDGQPFNAHCYDQIPYLARQATAGMIMIDQSLVFNLGKYETRCKLPNKDNIWSAFWMWHHDEIDIFDIAFRSKITHNVYSEGLTASVRESPCCPYVVDCAYCPTQNLNCTAAPNCADCGDDHWGCEYLAQDFHTIGCEWTPFKISFYIDDVTTAVVYRYYTLARTPVDVDCGDAIPEGLVRENPAFIKIQGRGFRPEIWITPEEDYARPCAYDSCFDQCDADGLPATLTVQYVKIEERIYEQIRLQPDCYALCENSNTPVCVGLESEYYNFIYQGIWNWSGPPPPVVQAWSILSANGAFTEQDADHACLSYNGPDCSSAGDCRRQLRLQAQVQTHDGRVHTLTQTLEQPRPELTVFTRLDGAEQVCIDAGRYCGSLEAMFNGQPVQGPLECFALADGCNQLSLQYDNCGTPVLWQQDCFRYGPEQVSYRIFPNPNAGWFTLAVHYPPADAGVPVEYPVHPQRIRVYNLHGLLLSETLLTEQTDAYPLALPEQAPGGMYIVEIWDNRGAGPLRLPVCKR